MKKYSAVVVCILAMQVAVAQFAPPAGQAGTTAMYKDSSAFVAWATAAKIKRGYQDISNPLQGPTTLGDSIAVIGKADGVKIVSLGDGGSAIVTFKLPVTNEPGSDFAVFENGFNDTFLELAFVEVSSDGVNYFRFPATSNTQDTLQMGNDAEIDARKINNLAGKYRANYGTPFDLEELAGIPGLDLNKITHVKITDVIGSVQPMYASLDKNGKKINDPWPTPFASSGFDLDAVGVIHQAPISVDETEFVSFQLYPNPVEASGQLQLVMDTNTDAMTIDLIDVTGRRAAVWTNKSHPQMLVLPLSEWQLKEGLYLLRVEIGNKLKTQKIIIGNE